METSIRLHPPTTLLGWLVRPLRWVSWRLNKPFFDQLTNAMLARANQVDQLAQLAQYTRVHADNLHNLVIDLQRHAERVNPRLDGLQNLAEYTRTHADNVLGLVFDAHKRLDALQQHADNVLGVARQADQQAAAARRQVEAETAQRASLVPPLAISPLMAQAITIDHAALTRRIGMIENLLVELQAGLGGSAGGDEATVLPLPAANPLRRVS